MILIFQRFFKLKFIKKTRVIKIMITIPLTPETKQQLSIKPQRRLLGALGWKNLQKMTISKNMKIVGNFSKKC